jgi:spore maturation protein CgeB
MTRMKLVVFGLSISSSWGNGHATLWRGLCRALASAGHHVTFFEHDVPYYRSARDLHALEGGELVLYESFEAVREQAVLELASADAALVTSYCPDGVAASELCRYVERPVRVFYDLDTPVTLAALESGQRPEYLSARGLVDFDLVLSFTGGPALELLRRRLGARNVAPLYGHVDPALHRPVPASERYRCSLSYLGTYAPDRQAKVDELFSAAASALPGERFVLGGAMYPDPFPANVAHYAHVPPAEHGTFFCSSRATLNVTREAMARLGHCPSGRLFEAAACGVPLLSDWFDGLDRFFEPGREIAVVERHADVQRALGRSDRELQLQAARARERVLAEHTGECRATQLVHLLEGMGTRARNERIAARTERGLEPQGA